MKLKYPSDKKQSGKGDDGIKLRENSQDQGTAENVIAGTDAVNAIGAHAALIKAWNKARQPKPKSTSQYTCTL